MDHLSLVGSATLYSGVHCSRSGFTRRAGIYISDIEVCVCDRSEVMRYICRDVANTEGRLDSWLATTYA